MILFLNDSDVILIFLPPIFSALDNILAKSPTTTATTTSSMAMSRRRKKRRIPVALYVPNILGYIRIILALIGLGLAVVVEDVDVDLVDDGANNGATNIAVLITWIVAAILDLFDGIIARKLNQTSQFGVLLDIISDNVLRTCTWIAVIISSISKQKSTSSLVTVITVLIATMIICLEWLTMVATQVHSSSNVGSINWKHARDNDHWLIKQFFKNNFRNPLGM